MKAPFAVVDAHPVVAAAALMLILSIAAAREAEVGRAVVAEIDLEDVRVAGLEPKRDHVVRFGPLHAQCVSCEPHVRGLEVVSVPSRRLPVPGGSRLLTARAAAASHRRRPGRIGGTLLESKVLHAQSFPSR